MFEKKDYSKLSSEELIAEETKLNKVTKTFSMLFFVSIGITIYALFFKEFSVFRFIMPLITGLVFWVQSQKLKAIKQEISNKKSA